MRVVILGAGPAGLAAAHSLDSELRVAVWCALWYSAAVLMGIAIGFVTRKGMHALGKSPLTGTVPFWSYLVFWPFHLQTWLYTTLHTYLALQHGVPVATEVAPGWWLGAVVRRQARRLRIRR